MLRSGKTLLRRTAEISHLPRIRTVDRRCYEAVRRLGACRQPRPRITDVTNHRNLGRAVERGELDVDDSRLGVFVARV
jgi:hypothetical protein